MAIQTYRLTVRVDLAPGAVPAMDEVIRQCAGQLMTMTVLLNKGRYKPDISATRTNGVFEEIRVHLELVAEGEEPGFGAG